MKKIIVNIGKIILKGVLMLLGMGLGVLGYAAATGGQKVYNGSKSIQTEPIKKEEK